MNYEIRRIPFERRSCQVCKDNDKGNFMTLHLKDEIEHAAERHGDIEVCYVCQKCGKIYTSKHPAVCQSALSLSRLQWVTKPAHCVGKYSKRSQVSQHERHKHPMAKNAARTGGATRGEQASRKLKVFTEKEENRMLDLEIQFREERNVPMRCCHSCLISKQIRDKRTTLLYKRRRDKILAA